MRSRTGSDAIASATAGYCCGSRLREKSRTSGPRLNASRRMPSYLRSKIHSGPVNRSCVSVAAIGSIQSGKGLDVIHLEISPRTDAATGCDASEPPAWDVQYRAEDREHQIEQGKAPSIAGR